MEKVLNLKATCFKTQVKKNKPLHLVLFDPPTILYKEK